jgi:hypothetical protein
MSWKDETLDLLCVGVGVDCTEVRLAYSARLGVLLVGSGSGAPEYFCF